MPLSDTARPGIASGRRPGSHLDNGLCRDVALAEPQLIAGLIKHGRHVVDVHHLDQHRLRRLELAIGGRHSDRVLSERAGRPAISWRHRTDAAIDMANGDTRYMLW